MTIEEIKKELRAQGMSVKDLSEKLGMSYTNTRLMLSGARPMSLQIQRHIDYILGAAKSQVVMITVDLPEAVARVWAPGWEGLTPEEKEVTARTVVQAATDALVTRGEALIDDQAKRQPGGGAATVGAAAPTGTTSADYGDALAPMA